MTSNTKRGGVWQCGKRAIPYGDTVLLMGILNVTPDSFSDGGAYTDVSAALAQAQKMAAQGADMLDIGAQSTQPGHTPVDAETEWARLQPVLPALRQRTDLPLSVDTYYPLVAQRALSAGADCINDVSGCVTAEMAETVRESGCGWVLMHNGAGGVETVRRFFTEASRTAMDFGVSAAQLCLDPGIGFGKSYEENMALLANFSAFRDLPFPLLLGTSRKRVIGTAGGEAEPQRRTPGNIAADTAAVLGGADLIRLHDFDTEPQGIRTANALRRFFR